MSSPVGNPPGWYADPWQPNMQRYWDGTQWTPHQTWNVAPTPQGQQWRPTSGPVAPNGAELAEWWRRLLGYVVDSLVMIPLYLPLLFVLLPRIVGSPAFQDLLDASQSSDLEAQLQAQERFQTAFAGEFASMVLLITCYSLAVGTAYFTFGIGRWGRTVGGKAMGIRAVTASGEVPGYSRAFKRYLPLAGCTALGLLPGLGGLLGNLLMVLIFVSMLWQPQRQAWHDLLAGTYVVRA